MPNFPPGARIAGYTLRRFIGEGRHAEVYEATSPEGARRALKIAREAQPLSAKPQARLGQEAEAIATIEHVNVVRFYDTSVFEGRVWIAMELVDGCNLRELVRNAGGSLDVERAVSLIRQACEGVAAAHKKGIIHRDLRPENILVTGTTELVKVADFSRARFSGWGVQTTNEQDAASSLYAAPEYLRRCGHTDRVDAYAIGLILYEISTGSYPIAPSNATAFVVCERQLNYDPPPLSAVMPAEREFPGDLSFLVQRAMAKDPAKRPSVSEMAEQLDVILYRLNVKRRAAARSVRFPDRDRDDRLAPTKLNFEAWGLKADAQAPSASSAPVAGRGGTIQMAAVSAPRGAAAQDSGVSAPASPSAISSDASAPRDTDRDASPPMPPSFPPTLRTPSRPDLMPTPAREDGRASPLLPAERRSTGIPVERTASVPHSSPRRFPVGVVLAGCGVLVTVGALAGWLFGRASVATPSNASPSVSVANAPSPREPAPRATPSASASAPASATPSSTVPRAATQRPRPAAPVAPRPKLPY
jgi:serine/threonine-protein kinase